MTSTPAILWETFGLIGLASAAAWAVAVLLLAAGIFRRGRWTCWLAAAVVAAAGVVLAVATSASIRSIEVDRSAEVLAAEAAGAKAVQEKLRGRAANVRFAEDSAADQADVAGVTVAEEEGAYERAVEEELAKVPAYRAHGKQARAEGKAAARGDATPPTEDAEATDPAGGDPAAAAAEPEQDVRTLPESQLVVADRFDRGNRAIAWSALLVSLGLVGMEYVRRFNSTFDPVWPLPLAGTPVDGLTAKEHAVSLPPGGVEAIPAWLESLTRKGESFLVFAEDDPLAGRPELPRVAIGRFGLSMPVRTYPAAVLTADRALAELVFETAWFGRGGFVVTGEGGAVAMLADVADRLERRRRCRASARRTLNVVWAVPTAVDDGIAERLAGIAAATNIRWARVRKT